VSLDFYIFIICFWQRLKNKNEKIVQNVKKRTCKIRRLLHLWFWEHRQARWSGSRNWISCIFNQNIFLPLVTAFLRIASGSEKWYGISRWQPYHLKTWYGFGCLLNRIWRHCVWQSDNIILLFADSWREIKKLVTSAQHLTCGGHHYHIQLHCNVIIASHILSQQSAVTLQDNVFT